MNGELWIVVLYEEEDYGRETSQLVGVFINEEKAVNFARETIAKTYPAYEYSKSEIGDYKRHVFSYFEEKRGQFDDGFKAVTYVVECQTVANDILPCDNASDT